MAGLSSIEWCDATWNPTRGCSRVSHGCERCYAERIAARFSTVKERPDRVERGQVRSTKAIVGPFHGFAEQTPGGPRWTGKITLVPEKLAEPLRWTKPRRIFVNSMSDLFYQDVPTDYILGHTSQFVNMVH